MVISCYLFQCTIFQIKLQDSSVFSVIIMATEFGLLELLTMAEEYIIQRLDVNNACLFLGAAFHLENMRQGKHLAWLVVNLIRYLI